MTLKELRKSKKITQEQCSKYLGIPLRTYQNYESDDNKRKTMKYEFMMQKLGEYGIVDENNGILTVEAIKEICAGIFSTVDVEYCYLFGSYAKGNADERSDVDLLVSSSASGLEFYDMVEALRQGLCKKVDVINREQLNGNPELMNEILKDGLKIYG